MITLRLLLPRFSGVSSAPDWNGLKSENPLSPPLSIFIDTRLLDFDSPTGESSPAWIADQSGGQLRTTKSSGPTKVAYLALLRARVVSAFAAESVGAGCGGPK